MCERERQKGFFIDDDTRSLEAKLKPKPNLNLMLIRFINNYDAHTQQRIRLKHFRKQGQRKGGQYSSVDCLRLPSCRPGFDSQPNIKTFIILISMLE